MNRDAGNHAVVEGLHPFLSAVWRPLRIGRGYVKESLSVMRFVRAGSVDRSFGGGALEWRSVFKDWRFAGRNGNYRFLIDEVRQSAESVAESLQKVIGSRVLTLQLRYYLL